MTAQISDRVEYKGEDYSLVAQTNPLPPSPYGYFSLSTACWRGFVNAYKITDDALIFNQGASTCWGLPRLARNKDTASKSEEQVDRRLNDLVEHYLKLSKDSASKSEKQVERRLDDDAKLTAPYTGKILIGKGLIGGYYIHMGFQRPYAYKTLLEFEFENGKLLKTTDRSAAAARFRERIDGETSVGILDLDVDRFVGDSFSLDYETKAWWLDAND